MFSILSLVNWKYVGIGLLLVAVLGGDWYLGYSYRDTQVVVAKAKEQIQEAKQVTKIEQADTTHVEAAQQQQVVVKTVIQKVNVDVEKIIDRPVYTNVCFDDDGLRDANAALSASHPQGTSDQVSGSNTTK